MPRLSLFFVVATLAAPPAALAEPPSTAQPLELPAPADGAAQGLDLYGGVGVLGSVGSVGSDVAAGLRLRAFEHFAASADLAYGLVGASGVAQDRWWAIPSAALVLPMGHLTLDLGGGLGVGTTSGYASWSAYAAAPFGPTWHHTVPAGQLHAALSLPLTPSVDLAARAQAGTLLGVPHLDAADGTWFAFTLCLQARVL